MLAWKLKAACVNQEELFFAPLNERPMKRNKRETKALAFCAVCPVIAECRVYGLRERYGIWGGLTESDR